MEYLNFQEISKVKFALVLDWLAIPYTELETELKGQGFIVNTSKNIYFNPTGSDKGSVINFVSANNGIGLREAAKLLKDKFLTQDKPVETKRPIPTLELTYCPFLEPIIPAEVCKDLNVGLCKQKSIMAGRICFKIGEHYVGYSLEKKDWFFPKGFKRDGVWNIQNCTSKVLFVTKDPFTALYMIANGYANTCSTIGIPTKEQMEIIQKYEIVLIG